MLLSFYTVPPQPAVESSLMLGSKLVRSTELRFFMESFHSSPHSIVTTKASNSQTHCTSCRLQQEEELRRERDLYSVSIIVSITRAHKSRP